MSMEAGGQASFLVEVNDPDAYDEFEVRIVNDLTRELSFTSAGRDTALTIGADTTLVTIFSLSSMYTGSAEIHVYARSTNGTVCVAGRCKTFEDDLRVMVYEMREHDVWRVYAPARMDSARTVPHDSISAVFRQAVVEINPPSILHRESEYWDGNENGKFDRFVGHAPFGRDEDLDLLDEFAVYLDFVDEDGPGGCAQTGRLATLYFDAPLVNHHRVTSVAPPDTQGRITRLNLSIVYPLQFQADTPLVTVGDFLSPSSNHISAIVVESSEYDKYIEVRDVNDPGKGLQDGDWAEAAFLTVYYTTTDVQGETRYDCSCMASDVEHTTTTHELLHMESVGPLEHPCREVNQDNIMWPFAGDRTGVKLRCRGIQVGPVGACIERQEQWSVLQGGL